MYIIIYLSVYAIQVRAYPLILTKDNTNNYSNNNDNNNNFKYHQKDDKNDSDDNSCSSDYERNIIEDDIIRINRVEELAREYQKRIKSKISTSDIRKKKSFSEK